MLSVEPQRPHFTIVGWAGVIYISYIFNKFYITLLRTRTHTLSCCQEAKGPLDFHLMFCCTVYTEINTIDGSYIVLVLYMVMPIILNK